jgi:hypothetical protein
MLFDCLRGGVVRNSRAELRAVRIKANQHDTHETHVPALSHEEVVVAGARLALAILVLAPTSCVVRRWLRCKLTAVRFRVFALPIPPPLILTKLDVVHQLAFMYARRWMPAFPTRLHSLLLCAALEANSEHSKTRHEQGEPRTEKTKQDGCQCGSTTSVLAAIAALYSCCALYSCIAPCVSRNST